MEVGGTTLRAGRFETSTRAVLRRSVRPTPNYLTGPPEGVTARLAQVLGALAREVLGDHPPDIVGLAFPGPVDGRGVALAAPTVMGAPRPVDLSAAGRRLWAAAELVVLNDLTAAGYRYVAAGRRDFCLLTVGSGIGNKVFLAGAPVLGPGWRGGEIGHLRVDVSPDALPCDCGGSGHVGGIASGRGTLNLLRRRAERQPSDYAASMLGAAGLPVTALTNERLVAAFTGGDRWTVEVVQEASRALGQAVAAIHLAVGVESFIVGGGFARALGEPYRALLAAVAGEACWNLGQDWNAMIELGIPDDDSGLIGAGLHASRALR